MKTAYARLLSGRNARLLVCSLVYQAVWFAAVYSARHPSLVLLGPGILVAGLALQLVFWRSLAKRAIVMLLTGLLAGVVIDGVLTLTGVLVPYRQLLPYPLPPLWLLTLWAGFGIYMATGLELMYGRPRVAVIAGGIAGPLAYRAGVPFGALELGANAWVSLAVVGVVWAITFPLLLALAARLADGGRTCSEPPIPKPGGRTCGEPRAESLKKGKQRPVSIHLRQVRCLAVLLLISTLGAPSLSLALQGDDSLFAPVKTLHDVELVRRGVGRLRRWMIKGCDIALYTPPATTRQTIFTGGPKALEFYYYVSIKGEQFARASDETLKGELSRETYARFKPQIDAMGGYFATVEPGDRYLLYFVPGQGTALDLNGKRRGLIPGDEFADIYFRIWLGEKPLDNGLYKGMTDAMK